MLIKDPNIKFHGNLFSGSRADTCGEAGGRQMRKDLTKVTDALREYANKPKDCSTGQYFGAPFSLFATKLNLHSFSY